MSRELICIIFDKALLEPAFGPMYAQLCFRISNESDTQSWIFEDEDGKRSSFKRLLLNQCQVEFEKER